MNEPRFTLNSKFDLLTIPFSPVQESDRLEIRVQVKNSGSDGYVTIGIYLDFVDEKHLIKMHEDVFVISGTYGFKNSFKKMQGLCGNHKIIIKLYQSKKSKSIIEQDTCETNIEVKQYLPCVLEGGFIMFGPPNDRFQCDNFRQGTKNLTDNEWKDLIDIYNSIGMKLIIITVTIQHLIFEGGKGPLVAHYKSKYYPKSDIKADDPIKAVLETAEKNGQKVAIGLGHSYGAKLPNTFEVMQELYDLYGGYSSFYGWYDSREEGISTPSDPDWSWGWTYELWMDKRKFADTLMPVKPIFYSPNTIGHDVRGITVSGIYKDIIEGIRQNKIGWNILVPQDTIGQLRKITTGEQHRLKQVTAHFSALKECCKESNVHLWANCESFNFDEKRVLYARFENGGMDGELGFVQQMEALRPYCEKIITFMLNGFFTPPSACGEIGGKLSLRQYKEYLEYVKNPCYVYKNVALNKNYSLSRKPQTQFKDELKTCTDGVIYGGLSFEADINRTFGYEIKETTKIEIEINLEEVHTIDKIKYAEHKIACYSPDRVVVYASENGDIYKYVGEGDSYTHGWMNIYPTKKINAKYIKLAFIKYQQKQDTLMFIDEIEVLKLLGD